MIVLLLAGCKPDSGKVADVAGSKRDGGGIDPAMEEVEMVKRVMVSPLAGRWFQDSEQALKLELDDCVRDLRLERKRGICAAVVPHAGYRYSGRVAAGVYNRIDTGSIRRVVVMGPSHYVGMRNQISIPDATHLRTPLGDSPVDMELVKKLRKLPFVTHIPAAHTQEHSDQIQIPMIQHYLSLKLPVVTLVCGQFDTANLVKSATALREHFDEHTLVVASSDFTHYGVSFDYVPFTNDVDNKIEALDMGVFELFACHDLAGFLEYLEKTGATVCGRDPLGLLLAMMQPGFRVERTGYDTSGRIMRDPNHSVSYVGALVYGTWGGGDGSVVEDVSDEYLSGDDCQRLLKLARESLRRAFTIGRQAAATWQPVEITPGMRAIRGGFVTLNKSGALRGCIGEIIPRREVWKVIREQVLNAAFEDPRFPQLDEGELGQIEIDLSLLTPPRAVESWREIVIGKHGVVLSKGGRSAVFLPQVAPEQGWGIEETLTQLALKAGLPADSWREGADYLVFEAQVVKEFAKSE